MLPHMKVIGTLPGEVLKAKKREVLGTVNNKRQGNVNHMASTTWYGQNVNSKEVPQISI